MILRMLWEMVLRHQDGWMALLKPRLSDELPEMQAALARLALVSLRSMDSTWDRARLMPFFAGRGRGSVRVVLTLKALT